MTTENVFEMKVSSDGTLDIVFKGNPYKKKVTDLTALGLLLFNISMGAALIPGTVLSETN